MVTRLQSSPVDYLNKVMSRSASSSKPPAMIKIIETAKTTIGISADNYLAWKDKFIGGTDYIDRISSDHLGDKHLMWGYDPSGRLFVTFQYHVTKMDAEGKKTSEKEISTLFQRYSDRLDWVAEGGTKSFSLSTISLDSLPKIIEELGTLLSGKTVVRRIPRTDKDNKPIFLTEELSLTHSTEQGSSDKEKIISE